MDNPYSDLKKSLKLKTFRPATAIAGTATKMRTQSVASLRGRDISVYKRTDRPPSENAHLKEILA